MKSVVEGRVVEGRVECSKWSRSGVVEVEVDTLEDGLYVCERIEIPTGVEFALTSAGKRVRVTVEEVEE